MKKFSTLAASVATMSLLLGSTAFAAPVMTVTAEATQVIKVPSCKVVDINAPLTTLTATFNDDDTFTIVDDAVPTPNTVLQGTWFKLSGNTPTSPFTVYMTPSVYAPAPDDAGNNQDPVPVPAPAGTLEDFLLQAQTIVEQAMTCKLKGAGVQDVTFLQPSTLIKKSTMTVKTDKNGVKTGTLIFQLAGKQQNMFTGTSKVSTFSTKTTIKGTVL